MIIGAMLRILAGLINWMLNLVPSWSPTWPSYVIQSIQTIMAYNDLLPASEILLCFSWSIYVMGAQQGVKWSVKIIDWIADVLP